MKRHRVHRTLASLGTVVAAGVATGACDTAPVEPPVSTPEASYVMVSGSPLVELGERLFNDTRLSLKWNQSCASCHDPDWGFTGPLSKTNAHGAVYEGSVKGRFGNRKPPTAAYATLSPVLHYDAVDEVWVGGNFWDGRATGNRLGNPAADQARGPFLNPAEQALGDPACVVFRVTKGAYRKLWPAAFDGEIFEIEFPPNTDALCNRENVRVPLDAADRVKADRAYDRVAL